VLKGCRKQSDKVKSVQDAVYAITEPEFLDGFSVDSHSRRRSSQDTPIDHLNTASFTLSTTTKQSLFETMPPVLILHLKRFVYDPQSNSISKLQKYLEYDTSLDLDSQKLFSSVGKRQLGHCTYKLFAVIYHHGRSVAGGHYTADVCLNPNFKSQPTDSQSTQERNGEGEEQPIWVQMDDALMQKVSVADVLAPKKDREAYLLFYARET
jgi:ubiquitin carboxyl-terminal hydrolase 10